MSNEIDIQLVKDNYSRMGNEELVHIATKDAAGMTPEAQAVIREELKKRNLDSNLIKGVNAQNKNFDETEFLEYCEIIRGLNCPVCGSSQTKLNATITNQVISFIIITHRSKNVVIGCPGCLDKANNVALITSLLLGWWGFPWGIIRTIQAVVDGVQNKKTNHSDQPNNYLKQIVRSKIGLLEVYKNNKEKLQEAISVK